MNGAPLMLYNSLTRSLEQFAPLDAPRVAVYSCGPTVYNYAHIGNLRAYIFTDTLSRVLTWKGYDLTHVINITDVGHLTSDADAGDDKMEAAARERSMSIWDIAAHYTAAFKQNLEDLNVRAPQHFPLATDHIEEMKVFAEKIAPDHCYQLDSGLYFDTSTVPDYGRLAGAREDERESRIDPVAGKRHPQDFAIWRRSDANENRQMEWDSPWGRGAPGWHLECSVMSRKYLGAQFDIHTGGIDHREIHHPNEIAQNQAFCGCADTGATFWMHNNFLVERSGRMSKSGGGFTTLQSLIDLGVHPLAYRLMCLGAQYRSELEFSLDNLGAALTRLTRMILAIGALADRVPDLARQLAATVQDDGASPAARRAAVESGLDPRAQAFLGQVDEAIGDDLNTARLLPLLDAVLDEKRLSPEMRLRTVASIDLLLGLNLLSLQRVDLRMRPADAQIDEGAVEALLLERKAAREARDFAGADAIRDRLSDLGVHVMDGGAARIGWDWEIRTDTPQ